MSMKKILLTAFVISTSFCSKAQFVNDGAVFTISNKAVVFLDMDLVNNGQIDHHGEIIALKNWDTNHKRGGILSVATGVVTLSGNDQIIGGTHDSNFPNLVLAGTGKKTLNQDVNIYQSLALNDAEFAVNKKKLTLFATTPESLTRINGFISTEEEGYFYRDIAFDKEYLFPMGTTKYGKILYRPVVAKLKKDQRNLFGVSFVGKDPTFSFLNRDIKGRNIVEINPKYFHVLNAENINTPVQISFYHNRLEDEPFSELANWSNNQQWEKVGSSARDIVDGNLNRSLILEVSEINKLPIALASANSNSDLTFYNSFSPDGDGKNDYWNIGNIDSYPDNEITIFNRWGGEVFRTKSFSATNKWDGSKLNEGTYYYVLKVKIEEEYKIFKGFISLIKKS
jgi:gliding motility-associated-like protein